MKRRKGPHDKGKWANIRGKPEPRIAKKRKGGGRRDVIAVVLKGKEFERGEK